MKPRSPPPCAAEPGAKGRPSRRPLLASCSHTLGPGGQGGDTGAEGVVTGPPWLPRFPVHSTQHQIKTQDSFTVYRELKTGEL